MARPHRAHGGVPGDASSCSSALRPLSLRSTRPRGGAADWRASPRASRRPRGGVAIARAVARPARGDPFDAMIRESLSASVRSRRRYAEAAASFRRSLAARGDPPTTSPPRSRRPTCSPHAGALPRRRPGDVRPASRAAGSPARSGALGKLTRSSLASRTRRSGGRLAAVRGLHEGSSSRGASASTISWRRCSSAVRWSPPSAVTRRTAAREPRRAGSSPRAAGSRSPSHPNWAIVTLELGLGRTAEAFSSARADSGTLSLSGAGRTASRPPCGRARPRRRAVARGVRALGAHSGAAWALAGVAHCRRWSGDRRRAGQAVLRRGPRPHAAAAARPFERARTELAYGEYLRRARRRVDAREHLRAALEASRRSARDLGRAGASRAARERADDPPARLSTRDELTRPGAADRRLVAEGLTNREVAAQLFVSPRTIDFHLRNVFRKLGITLRTELAPSIRLRRTEAEETPARRFRRCELERPF